MSTLPVRHAAAAVVVGMEAEHYAVPVLHILVQILDLGGENVGHCRLYCRRNIDNGLPVGIRLPYIQNGVAYLQGVLHLCSVEALGAVLKHEVSVGLFRQLLQKLCAVHGELLDLFFVLLKDLLPLCDGS